MESVPIIEKSRDENEWGDEDTNHVVPREVIAVVIKGVEDCSQAKEDEEGGDAEDQDHARVTHAACVNVLSKLYLCLNIVYIIADISPLETDPTCLPDLVRMMVMWQDSEILYSSQFSFVLLRVSQ